MKDKKTLETKELKIVENKIQTKEEDLEKEALDFIANYANLSEAQKKLFIKTAVAFGLNPIKREIHPITFKDHKTGKYKLQIVVGYETYLKRAERSGKYAGFRVWTEGEGENLKACIEVYRKDWERPLYHEVFLKEYHQNNQMWLSKPITMLKKVAICQAFRWAFPDELAGMPYTPDEMPLTDENYATIGDKEAIEAAQKKKLEEPHYITEEPEPEEPEEKEKDEEEKLQKTVLEQAIEEIKQTLDSEYITDWEREQTIAAIDKGEVKSLSVAMKILKRIQETINERKELAKEEIQENKESN